MGQLICRGSVGVAHDRLEKLVEIQIEPQFPYTIPPFQDGERLLVGSFDTKQFDRDIQERGTEGTIQEPDLPNSAISEMDLIESGSVVIRDRDFQPKIAAHIPSSFHAYRLY